jgi:putative transposase
MGRHHHKLDNLYEVAGFTKQAHRQYMLRRAKDEQIAGLVINSISKIREIHNLMGLKKIYKLISPDWIGRDRFIDIGVYYGLGIKRIRSYQRTTFSCKSACFSNLTAGQLIRDINRVWVSDITYYRVGEIFYYITLIEDLYSRRIVGYVASTNLRADGNCKALRMALSLRAGSNLKGLIHHSDRGVQYVSNEYLRILSENKIAVSMCDNVYENAHIERANGIIKNEYLKFKTIKTIEELSKELKEVVRLYNEERPHWKLDMKTPVEYEEWLNSIPLDKREELVLYKDKKRVAIQGILFN